MHTCVFSPLWSKSQSTASVITALLAMHDWSLVTMASHRVWDYSVGIWCVGGVVEGLPVDKKKNMVLLS